MKRLATTAAFVLGIVGLVFGVVGSLRNGGVWALLAGVAAAVAGVLAWWVSTSSPRSRPVSGPGATLAVEGAKAGADMNVQPHSEPVHHDVTNLFNERYFRATIETRVLAAKRHLRPVSVALLSVSDGPDPQRRADVVKVGSAISKTLRDSDIACHLDDGRFAFILEDTPEDGAVWTLERLRRALTDLDPNMVQWAGVACYPAHAFNSGELLSKSEEALRTARDWPQARIEVANAS